jgi:farnesyl-diphosphate farnesyltransferase
MTGNERELIRTLLEPVSRSFFKTLWVLPRSVSDQIGLAYLLARTTDTIADTDLVPVEQRLAALESLRARILGLRKEKVDFGELARHQGLPDERTLLEKVEVSLALLQTFPADDLELIRHVLDPITRGQESDLRRFAGGSPQRIVALQFERELDEYTYLVAGCVGEFWTRICRKHVFPGARLEDAQLLKDGVLFGKGLQLVNILRDVAADLRKGRCYLPQQSLREVTALRPEDLLDPASENKLRPLYNRYLDLAEAYLAAGWAYTNALPWRCVRVRLACAWPVLIGVKTLARLRTQNPLDPTQPIKISRAEMRGLLWQSVARYPFAGAWRRLAPLPAGLAAKGASGKAVASGGGFT